MEMNVGDKIATLLLIVGGLNWGLVAFDYNLVDSLFGVDSTISMIVYGLVGLAALWCIAAMVRGMTGDKKPSA